MGIEASEVLEKAGYQDLIGSRIQSLSLDVMGVDATDPRLEQFQLFLGQCIEQVQGDDPALEVWASNDSLNELIDTLECTTLTSWGLVFNWSAQLYVNAQDGTVGLHLELLPYEFAPIYGYTLQ